MSAYERKTAFITVGTVNIPLAIASDVKQRIDRFVRTTLVIYPDS